MQFGSQKVREALSKTQTPTLTSLRQTSKQRYQQTLTFMQEWTSDLMERESELQQQRQQIYLSSTSSRPSIAQQPTDPAFNVEQLIKGEFIKRMESLYIKQLALGENS
jgi:hypothetical protein